HEHELDALPDELRAPVVPERPIPIAEPVGDDRERGRDDLSDERSLAHESGCEHRQAQQVAHPHVDHEATQADDAEQRELTDEGANGLPDVCWDYGSRRILCTRGDGSLMPLTVGVIGGGQLARMMVPPAIELGIGIHVLAETPNSSAGIAATAVGDFRDPETVLAFARDVDVVTFDHEHVPQPVLAALVDAGVAVRPGPAALAHAQDKLHMRRALQDIGVPVPDWAAVGTPAELDAFIDGGRAAVHTPRGGYDGKGVRVVGSADEVADWFGSGPLLAEELIGFRRELAQLVARRPSGELALWPVVETVQQNGVCAEVFAPAPGSAGAV